MGKTEIPYDERRNLVTHQQSYNEKVNNEEAPEGNCKACAAVQCQFNITSKKVLKQLELDPMTKEIDQYECEDILDDPVAMAADLSYIDKK